MLKLKAVLLNTYKSNDFTNKDTGVTTIGRNKIQLLIEKPLKNGGVKKELIDLSIPEEKLSSISAWKANKLKSMFPILETVNSSVSNKEIERVTPFRLRTGVREVDVRG